MSKKAFKVKNSIVLESQSTPPVNPESGELYNDQTEGLLQWNAAESIWEPVGSADGGVGGIQYVENPSAERNTNSWNVYTDYLNCPIADDGTEYVGIKKTSASSLASLGDLRGQQRLQYVGTNPFGGLTLNNSYYISSPALQIAYYGVQLTDTLGGSVKNITSNAGANLSGFRPYVPLTGETGNWGTPSLTFTRNTTSPLAGEADFILSKPASNCLGEGVSTDFKIDKAYCGSILSINYLYSITGTYSTGDVTVWVYDKTNNKIIQPTAYQVVATGVAGPAQSLTFQTSIDSVDYRLIFHVSTTSASAYTLQMTNVYVSPQGSAHTGAIVTETTSYAPALTSSGGGAVTLNATGVNGPFGKWWRSGDRCYFEIDFRNGAGGASGSAGALRMSLPPGYTPDTSKMSSTSGFGYSVGTGSFLTGSTIVAEYPINYDPGTKTIAIFKGPTTGYIQVSDITASAALSIKGSFPVVGWASNTIVSSSADTRVVTCRATRSATQTGVNPNNSAVKITFDTANDDTAGGFDTANNRYVVKVPGKYRLSGSIYTSGTNVLANTYYTVLYVDGVAVKNGPPITASAGNPTGGSVDWIGQLAVGQYVELFLFGVGNNSASTLSVFGGINSSLDVELVQGPAQIQASEVIVGRFVTSASQTEINPNNSAVKLTMNAALIDTHGMLDAPNNRIIIPAPGNYQVMARRYFSGTNVLNRLYTVRIYKNGALYSDGLWTYPPAGSQFAVQVADIVPCVAGDVIEIYLYGAGDNSVNHLTATALYATVQRIGGV